MQEWEDDLKTQYLSMEIKNQKGEKENPSSMKKK